MPLLLWNSKPRVNARDGLQADPVCSCRDSSLIGHACAASTANRNTSGFAQGLVPTVSSQNVQTDSQKRSSCCFRLWMNSPGSGARNMRSSFSQRNVGERRPLDAWRANQIRWSVRSGILAAGPENARPFTANSFITAAECVLQTRRVPVERALAA